MNFSAGIQSRKRKRRLAEAEELATDEHGKTRKENQEWIPAFARMTKARGTLRQAQGPGNEGSRPSFPRRRESRDTSCKEWIPAFARMTKARCDGSTTATARHSPIYWPANANPILL